MTKSMSANEEIYMEEKALSLKKIKQIFQKTLSFGLDSGDHNPTNFKFSIESKKDDADHPRKTGHYKMKMAQSKSPLTDQVAFFDQVKIT